MGSLNARESANFKDVHLTVSKGIVLETDVAIRHINLFQLAASKECIFLDGDVIKFYVRGYSSTMAI